MVEDNSFTVLLEDSLCTFTGFNLYDQLRDSGMSEGDFAIAVTSRDVTGVTNPKH